jgi:hypothetical protein
MYLPLAQSDAQFVSMAVRGMGEPAALAPLIREEVARHSPDTPIYWPQTLKEAVNETSGGWIPSGVFLRSSAWGPSCPEA